MAEYLLHGARYPLQVLALEPEKAYQLALQDVLLNDKNAQLLIATYNVSPKPLQQLVRDLAKRYNAADQYASDRTLVLKLHTLIGKLVSENKSLALKTAYSNFKVPKSRTKTRPTDKERAYKRRILDRNHLTKAYRDNPNLRTLDSPTVEKITLSRLDSAYPPNGVWFSESDDILSLWNHHIVSGLHPDQLHEPIVIDEEKLEKVIGEDTSCVVRDQETGEIVLVVLRKCFDYLSLMWWFGRTITDATSTHQKDDDMGASVMTGLYTGAQSNSGSHKIHGLLQSHGQGLEVIDEFDENQCNLFAFFWFFLRHALPSEILNDFDSWIAKSILPDMSPEWQSMATDVSFTMHLSERSFNVSHALLPIAPPVRVMACNDTRPMHVDSQPHKWAVAYTANRDASKDDGGHFYLGSYGIKVEMSHNCLVVWRPSDVHGTSLQRRDPSDPNPTFVQKVISIITPPQLPFIWESYAKKFGEMLTGPKVEGAREAE